MAHHAHDRRGPTAGDPAEGLPAVASHPSPVGDDPDPAGIGPPGPSGADALARLRAVLPGPWSGSSGLGSDPARLAVALVGVAAVAVIAGVVWLLVGRPVPADDAGSAAGRLGPDVVATSPRPTGSAGTGIGRDPGTTVPAMVQVHAAGAVVAPGVHRLPAGSRVADLVAAAGGLSPDADVDRVNLAAVLVDGSRVYVPRRGEATVPNVPADGGSAGGGTSSSTPKGPVDLNTATAEELDTLPGVGPTTAQAIIDHRTRNGPFRSVEDLAKVRGIGPAKLAELRPLVTV